MVKYYITKSHSQKIIHYFYCLLQKISHSEFLWKPGMGSKKIFSPVMQFEEKKEKANTHPEATEKIFWFYLQYVKNIDSPPSGCRLTILK